MSDVWKSVKGFISPEEPKQATPIVQAEEEPEAKVKKKPLKKRQLLSLKATGSRGLFDEEANLGKKQLT